MKRVGYLMEKVAEIENLKLAFWKAARGKQQRTCVRTFSDQLGSRLSLMLREIESKRLVIGQFQQFYVNDPKKRLISAPEFSERVFHHALLNVLEPLFERVAVDQSYACRQGKGRLKATKQAALFARRSPFFLKMDVRRFFDSISHNRLLEDIGRMIKDEAILRWLRRIVVSYDTEDGRGLPIGSLTSQHFANLYLAPLDRYVMETLRPRGYVRYMDDFVLWGKTSSELKVMQDACVSFLRNERDLAVKDFPFINRTLSGLDFLGYRVFSDRLCLTRRSKVRFRRRIRNYTDRLNRGLLSSCQYQRRVTALTAFTLPVRSQRFRHGVMQQIRAYAQGLEPGDPGWLLEQQRTELPCCESQQEPAFQPEQQSRLSSCP